MARPEPPCNVGMDSVGDVVVLVTRDDCHVEQPTYPVDVSILALGSTE